MIRLRFSITTLLLSVTFIAIALFIFRYWTAPVYPIDTDRLVPKMTTEFPGVTIETDLNVEVIDEFPVWNRQRQRPPLGAGKAIEVADRYRKTVLMKNPWLKSLNEDHDWVFRSLELAPLNPDKGIWVWVANYNLRKKSIWYVEPHPLSVSIVVKLDGEIVEPRID